MRYMKFILGLMFFYFCLINATAVMAGEEIEIVAAEGGVTVSDAADSNQKAAKLQDKLSPSSVLATAPNGRAVVRVGNTGYIVLERNSKVEINTVNEHAGVFRHITGIIYYGVNSIKVKDRTLEVRLKTATIGIRGTRFLVTDVPDRMEVGIRKGEVNIFSQNDEFEIHKKSGQDEFESIKHEALVAISEEKNQFDKYKASTRHEFIEYKREFALGMDRMASFNGKRVDHRPLSGISLKDMETLEGYAGKWLSELRD